MTPFPRMKITKHKYVETVSLPGAAAGIVSQYTFAANNMFDPNYTGTGHQPMYRDEMAAQYNFYTVLWAHIKVMYPMDYVLETHNAVLLTADTDVTDGSTNTTREVYKIPTPMRTSAMSRGCVRKRTFDAKKFYHTSFKAMMADDIFKTGVGSSPTAGNNAWFQVISMPRDESASISSQRVTVEITYVCAWREPKTPTPS